MKKRQLEIAIICVGFATLIGLFILIYNSTSFGIPIGKVFFETLWYAFVTAFEIIFALMKLAWQLITDSWITALIIIGLLALVVLTYFREQK
jgi:hypothetical protein